MSEIQHFANASHYASLHVESLHLHLENNFSKATGDCKFKPIIPYVFSTYEHPNR